MTIALLCSGQGPQSRGMFALTANAPEAAPLFARAATLLGGLDPRALVETGKDEVLHVNRTGQILCALQPLAAAAALRDILAPPLVIAGYSVGEVAAWGVGGLLDANDVLDVVARRAEIMDAATNPGDGLLFVRGLARGAIDDLCSRHDAAIAIVSPGNAFVLGGSRAALEAVADEAKASGARIVELPVEVASHTSRLARATPIFGEALGRLRVRFPPAGGTRVLSGVDGAPVTDAESGLRKLAAQLSQTVQWADCLQGCVEAGANVFLELGPGNALSRMVTHAYPDAGARSLDEFRSLDGVRAWLARRGDAGASAA